MKVNVACYGTSSGAYFRISQHPPTMIADEILGAIFLGIQVENCIVGMLSTCCIDNIITLASYQTPQNALIEMKYYPYKSSATCGWIELELDSET